MVTSVRHSGIRASSAGMSVGVTTFRKASEALSFNRRTSQGGVVERQAFARAKLPNRSLVKPLLPGHAEM